MLGDHTPRSARGHGSGALVVAVAAAFACGSCAEHEGGSDRSERLNVLFISVDDLRPELGSYGAPVVSPNIDRLAAEGIRFERAYSPVGACAAARASMLTGALPNTTGVVFMSPALAEANPRLIPLPRLFKDAGYETLEIGKFVHVDEDAPGAWSAQRWMPPNWDQPHYLEPENAHMTGVTEPPRGPFAEAADVADEDYLDGKLAAHAIEELSRLRDRPFFMGVGFFRPHLPFNCPARYWELYDRAHIRVPDVSDVSGIVADQMHGNYEPAFYAGGENPEGETAREMIHGYRACVSYIDAQVGRLLDALDRLELADRTIVVLWGDHGFHLGEHGIWGKNTALEPSLRIPLILRAPGYAAGQTTAALVETADILPTLCELTGVPDPHQGRGTSLVSLLEDPARPGKPAIFGLASRNDKLGLTIRTDRYRSVHWVSIRDGELTSHDRELYDHESDAREYANVAADPERSEVLAQHDDFLKELIRPWAGGASRQ